MTMLINDPEIEENLIQQRQALGIDQRDEVWEGVYVMPPIANDDHQRVSTDLVTILNITVGFVGLGNVRAGINLASSSRDWKNDYRVPDIVVFMAGTKAKNHGAFWTGPADFVVEVVSPQERPEEKIPFYSRIGVRELLVVNSPKKALELHRHNGVELAVAGESAMRGSEVLMSTIVPLSFQVISRDRKAKIEVSLMNSEQKWTIDFGG